VPDRARSDLCGGRLATAVPTANAASHDAERFLADLRTRLAEFALELHPEKTRLIEFGRHAAANRSRRGDGSDTYTAGEQALQTRFNR
jgi:RNA-directed DNA polymerase